MARYRLRPGPRVSVLNYDERSQDDDTNDDDDDEEEVEDFSAANAARSGGVAKGRAENKAALPSQRVSKPRRRGLRERKRPNGDKNPDANNDSSANNNSYGNNGENRSLFKSLLTSRDAPATSFFDEVDDEDIEVGKKIKVDEEIEDEGDYVPDAVVAILPPHLEESNNGRLHCPPSDHDRHSLAAAPGDDHLLPSPPPPVLPPQPPPPPPTNPVRRSSSYSSSPLEPTDGVGAAPATTRCGAAAGSSTTATKNAAAAAVKERKRRRKSKTAKTDPDVDVLRRTSKRLIHKRMKFPFSTLPLECQSHILSLLPPKERLNSAAVCRTWRAMTSTPSLWSTVDLTQFRVAEDMLTNHCKCLRKCKHLDAFEVYRNEICKFVDHVTRRVRPLIKELKFSFDFGHLCDGWDTLIMSILNESRDLRALTSVNAKWDSTPNRPACLTRYCCLVGQMRTAIHRHIQRIHLFKSFLDLLSKKAKYLLRFRSPFDWTTTNVMYMTRFSKLTHLTLDHYQTFEQLAPWKINLLLQSLQQLQSLKISYVSPSFVHTHLYSFQSSSLRHLDISACVGFFLHRLTTPKLKSLVVARNPWQGTLKDSEAERAKIPCLREVLRGAPELRILNCFLLFADSMVEDEVGASAWTQSSRADASPGNSTKEATCPAGNSAPFCGNRSNPHLPLPTQLPTCLKRSSDRRSVRASFENLLLKICPCAHHGRVWKRISAPH